MALLPLFSFHACRYTPMAPDLSSAAKESIELRKHRAHMPLVLSEKLGWGQSVINKRSLLNKEIYYTFNHSNGKEGVFL